MVWESRANKEGFMHGAIVRGWKKQKLAVKRSEAAGIRELGRWKRRLAGRDQVRKEEVLNSIVFQQLLQCPWACSIESQSQGPGDRQEPQPLLLSYMKLVQQGRVVRIPFYSR